MRNQKGQFVKGNQEGFKKGHKIWLGKNHSENSKRKISIANSKPKIEKECPCGKKFEVWLCRKDAKFCSRDCANKAKSGIPTWNKGLLGWRKGEKHPWMPRGENHWSYKKDRSQLKKYDSRLGMVYQEWRMKVWIRDGFKCKINNQDCKGQIEAHHILGWTRYPELRYEVNNGITLCHAHHPRKRAEEKRLAPDFKELVAESNISL